MGKIGGAPYGIFGTLAHSENFPHGTLLMHTNRPEILPHLASVGLSQFRRAADVMGLRAFSLACLLDIGSPFQQVPVD